MKAWIIAGVMFALPAMAAPVGDAAVRKILISESVAEYQSDGKPCACPYNVAKNGSSCGARSAYNRPGGEIPLCFPKDVTAEMVSDWRGK